MGICVAFSAVLVVLSCCIQAAPDFSNDSYSYFEMSKTVFSDFCKVNTQRQYVLLTDYGISFPYFYPLLIAIVNACTGIGMYSGIVINAISAALTAFALCAVSKKYSGSSAAGAVTAFVVLCNPQYISEVIAARSIPVSILCTVTILYLVADLPDLSGKKAFLSGIAAGIAAVVRFDALALTVFVLIIVFAFSKGKRIKNSLLYFAGALIFMLPWIIFSFVNFGKPWISDNGGTAFLVTAELPRRFFTSDFVPETLFNSTAAWIKSLVAVKLVGNIKACILCIVNVSGIAWLAVMLAGLMTRKKSAVRQFAAENKKLLYCAVTVLVYVLMKAAAYTAVGYAERRYYVELWLMIVLFVTMLMTASHIKVNRMAGKIGKVISVAAMLVIIIFPLNLLNIADNSNQYSEALAFADKLKSEVCAEQDDPRVLFVNGDAAMQFGGLTGIKTFAPPIINDENEPLTDSTYFKPTNTAVEEIMEYIAPDYIIALSDSSFDAAAFNSEKISEIDEYTVYKFGVTK